MEVIKEWKLHGQLSSDEKQSEFASALEQGFRSGGWNGALDKGIQVRLAQRRKGYYAACKIAQLHPEGTQGGIRDIFGIPIPISAPVRPPTAPPTPAPARAANNRTGKQ